MHGAERGDLLLLREREVEQLIQGHEREIIEIVEHAYLAHAEGDSSLPQSVFLRFPDAPRNRIIALPAFLGGGFQVAGIKWIASFPENVSHDMERASAVVILNCARTGRPQAILEGARISAARTAASAVLAAVTLRAGQPIRRAALVGCGVINREVWRFLRVVTSIEELTLVDLEPERAMALAESVRAADPGSSVRVCDGVDDALGAGDVVSIATTALAPHIETLSSVRNGAVVLHVSLRDLTAQAILSCDNVVDDVEHVCRAGTSLDLAQQEVGHRRFIRCTLAELLRGRAPALEEGRRPAVFSPFGLGVLDLAVASWLCERAAAGQVGTTVSGFLSPALTPRGPQAQLA